MSCEHKSIHFRLIKITISKTSSCECFNLISLVTKFTSEGKLFNFTIKIALFIGGGVTFLAVQSFALMNMYVLIALSNWHCLSSKLSSTLSNSHDDGNIWTVLGQFFLACPFSLQLAQISFGHWKVQWFTKSWQRLHFFDIVNGYCVVAILFQKLDSWASNYKTWLHSTN